MVEDKKYKAKHFSTNPDDSPLFVQLCGNDPEYVLGAAQLVQTECNAVDINLGCPQAIAKKGNYGSFLLEKPEIICAVVKKLHSDLNIPVTCKIRCLPELKDTLDLVSKIVQSGCSLLTVHGRTKEQNKERVGACNWDAIKAIKEMVKIPVFANGGIYNHQDVLDCMEYTGVDGVMSSESLLENPALFSGEIHDLDKLAFEYLDLWKEWDFTNLGCLKAHMFKMLHSGLSRHTDLRNSLGQAKEYQTYRDVVTSISELRKNDSLQSKFGWYERYWHNCYVGNDMETRTLREAKKLEAKESTWVAKEEQLIRKKSVQEDGLADELAGKKLKVDGE
jgi:tRNA-dihydrouridine synthase 1